MPSLLATVRCNIYLSLGNQARHVLYGAVRKIENNPFIIVNWLRILLRLGNQELRILLITHTNTLINFYLEINGAVTYK